MAADEICWHRTLEGITKLMSEVGGKSEDLEIIAQLQESFRKVAKANFSKGSDFIKNVLHDLITKTDYIFLTAISAILASEATSKKKSEVPQKVPRLFEPIIQNLEDHLNAVERAQKKVANLYQFIKSKIDEAHQVDYKLSREYVLSLELKKYELDGELNTWKCYMEGTEGVLTEFDKEIKDYLSRESYKMKWMVGLFVVGTTVFTGGAGAIASGASAIAAAGIGATPLIGGGAAGGFVASLGSGGIYGYFKGKSNDKLRLQNSKFRARLMELKRKFVEEQNHSKTLEFCIYALWTEEAKRSSNI